MSSLDAQDIFASGPHSFRPAAWQRKIETRSFPGLAGTLLVDMGIAGRTIHQAGRLCAPTHAALVAIIDAIEAFHDAQTHTLIDNHAQTYQPVLMEHFELSTPIQRGNGFWCDYTCRYLQLP